MSESIITAGFGVDEGDLIILKNRFSFFYVYRNTILEIILKDITVGNFHFHSFTWRARPVDQDIPVIVILFVTHFTFVSNICSLIIFCLT